MKTARPGGGHEGAVTVFAAIAMNVAIAIAKFVVAGVTGGSALENCAREVRDGGGDALVLPLDVADAAAVEQAADDAVARWGLIDRHRGAVAAACAALIGVVAWRSA